MWTRKPADTSDSPTADVLQAAKATFYRKSGVSVPKDTAATPFPQSVYFQG